MAELNDNTSLTEIVNSALVQIGDTPIKSLSDDNDGKAVCARLVVEQTIREVQCHSSACWEELIRDDLLTMRSSPEQDTVFGSFVWNLPFQWLSINGVFDAFGHYVPWRIYGNTLHTKKPAKVIRYVKFSDVPDEWSAELKNCVIELLAAKLLGGIVKDYSASKQAIEVFWQQSFPRWVNNRAQNSQRMKRGYDGQLTQYYTYEPTFPQINTKEY